MEIIPIDIQNVKEYDADLVQQFTYQKRDYLFQIGQSTEFGMSNSFIGVALFRDGQLLKDGFVRLLASLDFISPNKRFVFFPFRTHFEALDLFTQQSFTIDIQHHSLGGPFTKHHFFQYDFESKYLLLAFYGGFEVYDLEKGKKIREMKVEGQTILTAHFGYDNLLWIDIFENNKQDLIIIDLKKQENKTISLQSPFSFFGIDPIYLKYAKIGTYNLAQKYNNTYAYSDAGLLNMWVYNDRKSRNLYSALIPTSRVIMNDNVECCEVEKRFVKLIL